MYTGMHTPCTGSIKTGTYKLGASGSIHSWFPVQCNNCTCSLIPHALSQTYIYTEVLFPLVLDETGLKLGQSLLYLHA